METTARDPTVNLWVQWFRVAGSAPTDALNLRSSRSVGEEAGFLLGLVPGFIHGLVDSV